MSGIRVEDLYHVYPGHRGPQSPAVDGISFEVREGEFYTLLGPSGCGKTTTLRCIAGLERPKSGTISLGDVVVVSKDRTVPTHLRDIGMVFQDYAVWPHMTVFENVAFPLTVGRQRLSRSEVRRRVEQSLDLVNMSDFVSRPATQLSGGQQQRISLARALVREPAVLLLDEPLSNLDAKLRDQMRSELRLLQRRIKVTTLFVTHDQVEALSLSNRVAVMSKGRIVQEGTPREIYFGPNSQFVASFVGTKTFLRGKVERISSGPMATVHVLTSMGTIECLTNEVFEPGTPVLVAVRPEVAEVSGTDPRTKNTFAGRVESALFTGESMEYRVKAAEEILWIKVDSRSAFRRRTEVFVTLPPAECVLVAALSDDIVDPTNGASKATTSGVNDSRVHNEDLAAKDHRSSQATDRHALVEEA